jgi:hypothetical protein
MYYILIINTNSNINIFAKNVYSNNELFSATGLRYINSILFIYILSKKIVPSLLSKIWTSVVLDGSPCQRVRTL